MITASAIKFPDGKILTGRRHHDIIGDSKDAGYTRGDVAKATQGFVDKYRTFYNRKEALTYAIACGQVVVGKANVRHVCDGRNLYSEDLY